MTSAGPPLTRHIVLLQALHAAPERAAALTAGLPPAGLDWRPEPEAWSGRETLAHLAAAEPPFYRRLQAILAAENPWLPRFGPETARPETAEALPALLAQFEAGRRQLLRFLSELPAADWDRPAVHETMGPTTLLAQVQNIVNHDAEHLSQLESVCQRWAARPPA